MVQATPLQLAICVLLTLIFTPLTAEAAISSVTVDTSRNFEPAAGHEYAEITIHGSIARADGSMGVYAVPAVLISGYSQGGAAQLEFLAEDLDPTRVYDGHLIQMIGLACWKREDAAPHFGFFGDCRPLPTSGDHAPVVLLASETDMLIYHPTVLGFGNSAFFTRNPTNPNWRQYEMAGISHLPESILLLGLLNQNSADPRPIFRAAFDNLTRWIRSPQSDKPPTPRYFTGSVDATDAFIPSTDADGHFAGGVRLPHVESEVRGRRAGAPLGRHTPLNPLGLDPFHPFVLISGTFTRFSDAELLARYQSREIYVTRVKRAAENLASQGYITNGDSTALVAAAGREPLPCRHGGGNDFQGETSCPQ